VIATANLGELLDTAALLASQPVPTGARVAMVSNTRGGAMLAADACADTGLQVAILAEAIQRALQDILPPEATVAGPVDTTVLAAPGVFRQCLELAGTDPAVDAVLALTAATAASNLASEATPPGNVPDLEGLHKERASELIAGFLAGAPADGWLPRSPTAELLGCYGVPLAPGIAVTSEDAAIAAAERFGGPVALRADVPGLMRTSDIGTVVPGLDGADKVRRGFRSLRETFGDRLAAVIVQPMITGGVEVAISVLQEQLFGPLVLFGLATDAGALADRTARLAPLTGADADDLIRSTPGAPLLSGRRGTPAADLAALRDMLLRVSRMADDLPQIAELELNPVLARPDGAQAIDGQVRLQAAEPTDAYLRRLPQHTRQRRPAACWRRDRDAVCSMHRPALPASTVVHDPEPGSPRNSPKWC
jgi:acyl-CoA synthetase (NDP forming)